MNIARCLLILSLLLVIACSGPEPSKTEFVGDIFMIGDVNGMSDSDPIKITLDLPDGGRMDWNTTRAISKHLDPADVIIKRKGDTHVAVFRDGKQLTDGPFLKKPIDRDQYWKPTENYGSPIAGMDPKKAHEQVGNEKVAEAEKAYRAGKFEESWQLLYSARFHFRQIYPDGHPRLVQIEGQIEAVRSRY